MVLETANRPAENLKSLFEPGGQMAIEMNVVRHDNTPVESDRRFENRNPLQGGQNFTAQFGETHDSVVDLTEEVREAMILTFPGYPICRESCKGLCPKCGKNLNDGPCGCRAESEDCWAGLDALE